MESLFTPLERPTAAPEDVGGDDLITPVGNVPTPFPQLAVNSRAQNRRNAEQTQIFNVSSTQQLDVAPAIAQAYALLEEVQDAALFALLPLLEPILPGIRTRTLAESPSPPTSPFSSSQLSQRLQIVANALSSTLSDSPASPSTPAESLTVIQQSISSVPAQSLLQNDIRLAENILLAMTSASRILSHSPTTTSSSSGHPLNDSEDELEEFRQKLARLFQSSALDDLSLPLNTNPAVNIQNAVTLNQLADVGIALLNELTIRREQSQDEMSLLDHRSLHSELPPEYEHEPPAYGLSLDGEAKPNKLRLVQSAPDLARLSQSSATNEKMQLDLDHVTQAIERMQAVAPQIPGQRVELDVTKRQELELARIMGSVARLGTRLDSQRAQGRTLSPPSREVLASLSYDPKVDKGKGRANDSDDLEDFLETLSRAQGHRLMDQRAEVSANAMSRLRSIESAKARTSGNDASIVDRIQQGVQRERFHSQSAIFSPKQGVQDSTTLLTLPEFINESRERAATTSTASEIISNDHTEMTTPPLSRQGSTSSGKGLALKHKRSLFGIRPRSNSVPVRETPPKAGEQKAEKPKPSSSLMTPQYVAEHQENLGFVSVQITLPAATASNEWKVAFDRKPTNSTSSSLLLKSTQGTPPFIVALPVAVPTTAPDAITSKRENDRLEVKLSCPPRNREQLGHSPLLDAAQLNALSPATFICASCSLPLIQCRSETSGMLAFADLPSEYWAELVEAWMCHSEQKLSADVVKQSKGGARGTQPTVKQALVGGSYLLVNAESVKQGNLRFSPLVKQSVEWRPIRCICGAALGARGLDAKQDTATFRFAKYAIRPTGGSAGYHKPIPISAYVVADMMEIIQAHASYRFVIHDEEEEKVRMLIWLFNPSVRVSHSVSRAFALTKTGSTSAAKVFFKLVGPKETLSVEQIHANYPDFAAGEHLFYPISVCHSLATLLQNTNIAYPPSMRLLGNLNLGWLPKA